MSTTTTITIAIIEDEPDIQKQLLGQFAQSGKIRPVVVTDHIERFLSHAAPASSPNVILLDINLPGTSGFDALPDIRKRHPDTEIIMFSINNDYDLIFEAIRRGANGYLLKDTPLDQLEQHIIDAFENGGCALSPGIARRMLHFFQPKPSINKNELSEREEEVVRLLADGLTYKEVAESLNISINGVRYHIKSIYPKLQINSKGGLLKRFREGKINFRPFSGL